MADEQIIRNVTEDQEKKQGSQPSLEASAPQEKKKDPKKVAAGKALARKNAEARKNTEENTEENTEGKSSSLSFNDVNYDIQTAAGFVGAGFVLYHGWKFFDTYMNKPKVRPEAGCQETKVGSRNDPSVEPKETKKSNSIEMN